MKVRWEDSNDGRYNGNYREGEVVGTLPPNHVVVSSGRRLMKVPIDEATLIAVEKEGEV